MRERDRGRERERTTERRKCEYAIIIRDNTLVQTCLYGDAAASGLPIGCTVDRNEQDYIQTEREGEGE